MGIPSTISEFLNQKQASYEVLVHGRTNTLVQAADACEVDLHKLVRALVLVDGQGLIMAVLPADHVLDFDALCKLLHRDLELVPGAQLSSIFDDCEPNSYPPLPCAYDLEVVIDSSIKELDTITLEPGIHNSLIQFQTSDYLQLMGNAQLGYFSTPSSKLHTKNDDHEKNLAHVIEQFTPARLKKGVEEFHELPPLPTTAAHILEIASDPMANARDLANIIEQDPSLAAQVLRYANSSLYGNNGTIKDLKSAIARVLGFEFVLNLSLGLSIGKALRIPPDGPFGLDSFWRHAVYSARLVEQLAQLVTGKQRPPRGTAYLAGLLQNIGRLVLGQTFQPEFFILNRFAQENPGLPTCELEHQVLGVTHDEIGAWLAEAWKLPAELIAAIQHHHDENYWDEHAVYPQLVLIANRALAAHGLGEVDKEGIPAFSMEMLGLDEEQVLSITEGLFEQAVDLNDLAHRLGK